MLNINIYEKEGKNKEDLLNNCLDELNTSEDKLIINYLETEGSLFKSKKIIINAIKKEDIIGYIKDYFKTLSKSLNTQINVEIRENDDIYNINLITDNNAILIGKDGRSLNSIQILLRQSISNKINNNLKINIDIANYKEKKEKRLTNEINKIAKEIINSKIDVSLDPMNSYERRIVHCIISDYPELATESIGEGLERHVVIKYVEK